MSVFGWPRVVNNSSIKFIAPLDLFTINGVPITDFSIFADAINPVLILVDSTQPVGIRTIIPATLDFTVDFQFTCITRVIDLGGQGGIGMPWVKVQNAWLPNVWNFCFSADKDGTAATYEMELERFGVDPRAVDIAT